MDSMAGLAMDIGDSVVAEDCLHNTLQAPGLQHHSTPPIETQDWIESCYSKLHAVSRALDNHLTKSEHLPHDTADTEEDGYRYYPDSRTESAGDPDELTASTRELDGLNSLEFCKSNCCHLHDDYDPLSNFDGGDPAPFDLKGKRFSKYLQLLRDEGHHNPFEETVPSGFHVPDALSIMDAKITELKAKKECGNQCTCSSEPGTDESLTQQCGLDMDTSLQEYLDSDNDIMSHPLYKRLCAAHISLCKVNHLYSRICAAHIALSKLGATDAQLKEMEELSHELENNLPSEVQSSPSNPELDNFMNEYCDFLENHKEEFAKPFDEGMEFCKQIDEELVSSGLRFLRDNCPSDQSLTNDTIARLQELPFEGEV